MQVIAVKKVVDMIEVIEALLNRNIGFRVIKKAEDHWEISVGSSYPHRKGDEQ